MLVGLRYRPRAQQTLQNCSAPPSSRYPQTTRIKAQRPKKHCKTKSKYGEMRKTSEQRTDVKLWWETLYQ